MSADASKPRLSVTGSPDQYKPTYGDPKVSTSNDVAFQKEPRFGLGQGAHAPEGPGAVGANSYPGRPYPPVSKVESVKPEPAGEAKEEADEQLTENRQDLK